LAESRNRAPKRSKPPPPIVLRAEHKFGAAAAEDDAALLATCFVEDGGHYKQVLDPKSRKFLIKGRTGSGKTALIAKIQREVPNVIKIDPESLCLEYISNSDVIRYLAKYDVAIEHFFEIIWRHTFATELLRRRFKLYDERSWNNWITKSLIAIDPGKRKALEYLKDLGIGLWPELEERVTNITKQMEHSLDVDVGITALASAQFKPGYTESEETRIEVKRKVEKFLGNNQLSKLKSVIEYLQHDAFSDDRSVWYVCIDDLDRVFVDDAIRLRLLRSLIDTAKKFAPIPGVKFCIAIRSDLLEEIFISTRDRGYQEEKYDDSILTIRWSKEQLFPLLQRRIQEVFRRQYSKQDVTFSDIFAGEVNHLSTKDYLLDRTLLRPRDAILLLNECLEHADGKPKITGPIIKQAETSFSEKRYRSLQDEWRSLHPMLDRYMSVLLNKPVTFDPGYLDDTEMETLGYSLAIDEGAKNDRLAIEATRMIEQESEFDVWRFKRLLLCTLYKVGAIGLKTSKSNAMRWSSKDIYNVTLDEITESTRVEVHPMLWNRLNTRLPSR